eukprot:3533503-Alexandrium_andersonii.AAC.1
MLRCRAETSAALQPARNRVSQVLWVATAVACSASNGVTQPAMGAQQNPRGPPMIASQASDSQLTSRQIAGPPSSCRAAHPMAGA